MKPSDSGPKWSKVGGKFKSTPDSRSNRMKNGGHVSYQIGRFIAHAEKSPLTPQPETIS